MFPKPWYRPPWEGGRSAERDAFACPSEAKYDSFAAFWSYAPPALGLGVPPTAGECCPPPNDAGDAESLRSERPVFVRAEARDLRSPCADEGRLGGLIELLGEPKPSGGADGDHDLPANVASSW